MRQGTMVFGDGAWTIEVDGLVVHGPASASSCSRYCTEHHIVLSPRHVDPAYQAIDLQRVAKPARK